VRSVYQYSVYVSRTNIKGPRHQIIIGLKGNGMIDLPYVWSESISYLYLMKHVYK
jgi:hypothetical protein